MAGLALTMLRRGSVLTPTSQVFEDDLRALPEGKELMVDIWRARNPAQLRWYWATITALINAGYWQGDRESLHRALKIGLGLVEEVISADGEVFYALKSVSPARMDRTEFEDFLRRLEQFLAERWGVDVKKFRSEVRQLAGRDAEPQWGGQAMRLGGGSPKALPAPSPRTERIAP